MAVGRDKVAGAVFCKCAEFYAVFQHFNVVRLMNVACADCRTVYIDKIHVEGYFAVFVNVDIELVLADCAIVRIRNGHVRAPKRAGKRISFKLAVFEPRSNENFFCEGVFIAEYNDAVRHINVTVVSGLCYFPSDFAGARVDHSHGIFTS